jgi:hypothetical protein|nr:MAG TPA: hypothetical protein [Bacteriophage sp.]
MNHVVIVRKDKIEKIEMAENLSHLVSIVSKPVNADVLSSLIKNKDNNDNNPLIKTFYENVIRFTSRGKRFGDGSGIFNYYGVENVLGDWANRIRQVMVTIANKCGEKEIAKHVKPASGLSVSVYLTSLYSRESFSLETFNVISVLDSRSKAKLIVKNDGIEQHVEVTKGDVILVTSGEILENTTVNVKGHGEILSIQPNQLSKQTKYET